MPSVSQVLMPRQMPNAIAAGRGAPLQAPQPFVWGPGGVPVSAAELARQRAISDSLRPDTAPTGPWSLAGDLADEATATYRDAKAADTEKQAQQTVADALSRGDYQSVIANDMATPQQSAVAQALWQQQMKQSDPAYKLDEEYKQAQIDALKDKPAQSLINTANGIYDPNDKSWIAPPGGAAASDAPIVTIQDDGRPDPASQDAFLKSIPDQKYAQTVKAVANYELDPRVASKRGDAQLKLIQDAKAFDPTYDASQFPARMAARKSFTSGPAASALNSANLVIGHLYELKKASDELGNGSIPLLNAGGNFIKSSTGNSGPTKYGIAAQASADELAKVFKGTGASDVESIKGWQSKLDQNASPDQQKAAIAEAVTLLQSRVAALRDQYQNAMGRPADFQFLNEHSAEALAQMGIDPAEIDPNYKPPEGGDGTASAPKVITGDEDFDRLPSGAHFVGPDGVHRVKP